MHFFAHYNALKFKTDIDGKCKCWELMFLLTI